MTVYQAAQSGWKFQPEIKFNVNGNAYVTALPKDATKCVNIYAASALKDTVAGATSVKELKDEAFAKPSRSPTIVQPIAPSPCAISLLRS